MPMSQSICMQGTTHLAVPNTIITPHQEHDPQKPSLHLDIPHAESAFEIIETYR